MKYNHSYFLITLILALCCINTSYSQGIPDSLLRKLSTSSNDSIKAITFLEIGESIEVAAPEKSMTYYQQALGLALRIKNNRVVMFSYHNIGVCYINLNKMDSAIRTFESAIPLAKQMNDTIGEAKLLGNIGNAYLHKNDRLTGIEYYMKSARLWETATDQKFLTLLYCNINGLLNDQQEYTRAREYGEKALALGRKTNDRFLPNAMINLSTTYSFLGEHEKEFKLLEEALPLSRQYQDPELIASVYQNMGDYYFKQEKFFQAREKYHDSYTHVKQMGNKYLLSTISALLAKVYQQLDDPAKALKYIREAEQIAEEVGSRPDIKEIYKTRAEVEHANGNYKVASDYFKKTLIISDSLFRAETSERVAAVEAQYQNEKKQKEIAQLEADKKLQQLAIREKSTLNYLLIGSVAVLLLIGFLGYRNLRHRHRLAKQQEELQKQRIRELEKDKQLVAVDSLLKGQEEERSRLAKDLHDGLGGLLSGVKFSLSNMKDNLIITPDNMLVFERSLDMIDTSIKELRRVAHNMMPEMLSKFGLDEALKEYCNSINTTNLLSVKYQSHGLNERLDKSVEIIIYRIVQELLNNTLKHANAKEAFVQVIKENKRLNVVVEDNGKGFDSSLLEKSKGAGWSNIRSRVEYLKGQLDVHSEPGKGTLVNIEFNV